MSDENNSALHNLQFFFDDRASSVSSNPSLKDLCFVSGRDSRLWAQQDIYEDMISSICDQLQFGDAETVLEVGCAAGFLAQGLQGRCKSYHGVDISAKAVAAARRLQLPRAHFQLTRNTRLPYADNSFDRVLSYDVFTNFPSMDYARTVMAEMLRVTRPGGKFMVASLADVDLEAQYPEKVAAVCADLDNRFGPESARTKTPGFADRLRRWFLRKTSGVEPKIFCYYFQRADFQDFGEANGLSVDIFDIHQRNPYHGYRFNVVYSLPAV